MNFVKFRLGQKHFCSQTHGHPGKPNFPEAATSPRHPQQESSTVVSREVRCASSQQKYGDIKNTCSVSCSLWYERYEETLCLYLRCISRQEAETNAEL